MVFCSSNLCKYIRNPKIDFSYPTLQKIFVVAFFYKCIVYFKQISVLYN